MNKRFFLCVIALLCLSFFLEGAQAQEKRLERIRVGGGSTSATQMALWLAAVLAER